MKILILQDDFPPYENGGAGVIAGLIAKGFVARGLDVYVITTIDKRELEGKFYEDGMTIYRIYSNYHERWRSYLSIYNFLIMRKIKKLIQDINPDVVHAHNIHYHLSYHCLSIARKITDRVYLTTHDIMSFYPGTFTEFINKDDLFCPTSFNYKVSFMVLLKAFRKRFNPFRNVLIRYYLSKVKKIVTVSETLKEALGQNGIKNCVTIYNGIDFEKWGNLSEKDVNDFKSAFGLGGKEVILFGGRLSGPKGGYIIIEALARVAKERSDILLVVFGKKGSYIDKMLNRAKELKVDDKIIFTGWSGEEVLKKYYSIADVVVVPSVCFDSFPTVNLQALASKKPVIATCFGGSRELIRDNVNGFIVNPFNVEKLASLVKRLLADKEMARRFGQEGYKIVSRDFSLQRMINDYCNLFNL